MLNLFLIDYTKVIQKFKTLKRIHSFYKFDFKSQGHIHAHKWSTSTTYKLFVIEGDLNM